MKRKLYNKKESVSFYEKRYVEGYMEGWPVEKKQRINQIIQDLGLPSKGKALDFGCGNGILTEIIREALPDWEIYGVDISKTAIQNAKLWFPNCIFFDVDNPKFREKKFDFVFTHHVFEHVHNLQETFDQMVNYLKRTSNMLHFLPCGNKGSFPHKVCLLRKDGINPDMGNRFFFESEGHVRRLTTEQFRKLAEEKGFCLAKEYYSGHHYGAIESITNSKPGFVLMFTNSRLAINKSAKWKLIKLRLYLMSINLIRLPAQIVERYLLTRSRKVKHHIFFILAIPLYLFSYPAHLYWKRKAKEEFAIMSTERNGSEMTLFFTGNP